MNSRINNRIHDVGGSGAKPHAYSDVVNPAPRDARERNPLNGSQLMHEDAGQINLLFPFEPTAIGNGTVAFSNAFNAGTLTQVRQSFRIPLSHVFALTFTDAALFSLNTYIRFYKNNTPVTDYLPIISVRSDAIEVQQPISPFAGPATVTPVNAQANVGVFQTNKLFRFATGFDQVEFLTDSPGSVHVQGMYASGDADFDFR